MLVNKVDEQSDIEIDVTPQDRAMIKRLATACHILYVEGQNDFNHGQVSSRRGASDSYWIRGAAMGFDEASESSFALSDVNGQRQLGKVVIPPEWPIHSAVYQARADINAIVHSHAPNALVFGARRRELIPISHDGCLFGDGLGYFDFTTNTVLDMPTANELVSAMGSSKALLLKNHGLVTVGANIKEAVVLALCLEQACALQLKAESSGHFTGSSETDVVLKRDFIFSTAAVSTYWSYFERKVGRIKDGLQLPEHRQ